MKEKEYKKLIIDIDKELHANIKAMAALRNISIKRYVMRIVIKTLNKDLEYTNNTK